MCGLQREWRRKLAVREVHRQREIFLIRQKERAEAEKRAAIEQRKSDAMKARFDSRFCLAFLPHCIVADLC